MRDLRLLMWLRWRQFRDGAVYWLRVMGYQPGEGGLSQQLYVVYLGIIGLFWVFAMWAWSFDQVSGIGSVLPPDSLAWWLHNLPIGVLLVQVYVMVNALRGTPLKLSFADMAYIAGSPMRRSAPVILGFVRQSITRALVFGLLWALVAVMLTRALSDQLDALAGIRALAALIPLVVLTWGLGWLLGILRLVYPGVSRLRGLWLLPLSLIGAAYFVPDALLWPGRLVILNIYSLAPLWMLIFMVALALIVVATFVRLGERINMVQAIDESVMYARIQALGLMAWRDIRIQLRIRMQTGQAGRKPMFRLPAARGRWAFITRAALSYARHPLLLISCLVWGALITFLGVQIVAAQAPPQLWIGWLLLVGFLPPAGLLHVFRADVEEPFLRQFLPVDGLQLFMSDVLLPLAFLIMGSVGMWVLQGFDDQTTLTGLTFIPVLAFMLALCGAVSLTHTRVLQTRLIATALSFGLAAVAGVNLGATVGFFIIGGAVLIMMGMLAADA